MKLCHVVPSLQEQHGGPSKSVLALCRALARAGHSVELLTTAPQTAPEGIEANLDGLQVRMFRRDWPTGLYFSAGLRRALAETDAAIIHHHALWLRTLHYARRAAGAKQLPLVLSPRGMMSHWAWHHHAWRKRCSRLLIHPGAFTGAAGWHVTSEPEQAEVRSLGFSQPICIAPNGVEAPSEAALAQAEQFWRQRCPEAINRPTALFYGRFHQKKRVLELIDVWLDRAPPEWLLLLVGLPEQYTPEILERYVVNRSASGRVRAFNGTGLPPPYAIASLFLLPSHNENFGMTVAEAMAHGVPALVTDTTPWQELNRRQCGWCVQWAEYGSAISTATALSPSALRALGAQARPWVLREFSWDRSATVLGEFYVRLVARSQT